MSEEDKPVIKTAGELIQELSKLPADTHIFIRGYELGLEYIGRFEKHVVEIDHYVRAEGSHPPYFGRHDALFIGGTQDMQHRRDEAEAEGKPEPQFVKGIQLVGQDD